MSNRTRRVNELLQQEISRYLHTRYQAEAVRLTITVVDVSPDLHDCRVFYSVIGGGETGEQVRCWLEGKTGELRREVGRHVILKQTPKLVFILDNAAERGVRVNQLLDEVESRAERAPGTPSPKP